MFCLGGFLRLLEERERAPTPLKLEAEGVELLVQFHPDHAGTLRRPKGKRHQAQRLRAICQVPGSISS